MSFIPKRLSQSIINKLSPETIEHITAIDILHIEVPWIIPYLIHIPNERKCTKLWGYILQRMGVLKGCPDVFIFWPTDKYHGLFIEVKTLKGRPTKEQKEVMKRAIDKGYHGVFAYGCDEVVSAVKEYLASSH